MNQKPPPPISPIPPDYTLYQTCPICWGAWGFWPPERLARWWHKRNTGHDPIGDAIANVRRYQ